MLVNSAGAARRYLPEDLNADAWHAAMDAKYFTYIHAMDAVLPGMAPRPRHGGEHHRHGRQGRHVAIHLPGGAANSALMLATVGLANVYGPKGVRINAVNPGATLTERVTEALKLEAKSRGSSEAEVLAQGQAKVPLRRYAAPEDVADLTLFLASAQRRLHHRCDRADGRRLEPGALTRGQVCRRIDTIACAITTCGTSSRSSNSRASSSASRSRSRPVWR